MLINFQINIGLNCSVSVLLGFLYQTNTTLSKYFLQREKLNKLEFHSHKKIKANKKQKYNNSTNLKLKNSDIKKNEENSLKRVTLKGAKAAATP